MDSERITAKKLQALWGIDAAHALYFKDGNWYHNLTEFPGVLFDPNGYVIFNSLDEYTNSPYLNINRTKNQLHVPNGISQIPGYVRFSQDGEFRKFSQSLLTKPGHKNPQRVLQIVSRVIRDTILSHNIKLIYDCKCQLCGTAIVIKESKQFYAEAHHIKPLGVPHNGPDILENILCVCPNHHVQLDYGAIKIDKVNIYRHPEHIISDEFISYHNQNIAK